MSDLIQIKGHTHYISGPLSIGVVVNNQGQCVLIDSGLNDGYGKRILRIITGQGWNLKAVICTHSHGDHAGACAFLKKEAKAAICTSPFESILLKYPNIELYNLYSAAPIKELEVKFLKPEKVTDVQSIDPGKNKLCGMDFEIIPLPGHTMGHIGVVTPDNILFLGDAICPIKIWEKYKLPYFKDIKQSLITLDMLNRSGFDGYVIGHGGCHTYDIHETIDYNIDGIRMHCRAITEFLVKPATKEQIIDYMIKRYKIPINIVQYFLVSSCISAYLSYLSGENQIQPAILGDMFVWKKV